MDTKKSHCVYVEQETGTHLVLRCSPDVDGGASVFGPDTFSACIQWINTRGNKSGRLPSLNYKVFRNYITQTCFISARSDEPADSVEVHGPNGFAECLEWMRFRAASVAYRRRCASFEQVKDS
jgi:hypothetical protein